MENRHGPPVIYSAEYYQRIADVEERHWWHLGMRAIATALLEARTYDTQYGRVLDAGCGTGGGLRWSRERLRARGAVGVDVSWHALVLCRARVRAPIAQASVLELPFRADTFDLLVCQDVLQHLPANAGDARALREMHRVLRPGGALLLRSNARGNGQASAADPESDFQRYGLADLVARFEVAGFVVARATYANVLPALLDRIRDSLWRVGRRHGGAPRAHRGGVPTPRPVWLNRLLLLTLLAEARFLVAPGRRLGFGGATFCLGVKRARGAVDDTRASGANGLGAGMEVV